MGETKSSTGNSVSAPASTDGDGLRGRLVLVTGSVVAVPAEGVAVSSEHFDEAYGVTVPVVSRFVLS